MKALFVEETVNKISEEVELFGWAETIRDHKKIVFIDLRDSSGVVQLVGGADLSVISPEDVLRIKGTVKARPDNLVNDKISTGKVEVTVKDWEILSKAETLPFEISGDNLNVTLPVLLNYRALSLRNPKIKAIFEIQEIVIDSFRNGLKEKQFTEFQSPVIIPQPAEGGAEVFEVKYFDYKAYLAQSPQFYKQIMVGVFERVFTVSKTLRAEPSVTTRHLTEATTLDAEFGFIDSWEEIMAMAEYIIKFILKEVNERGGEALKHYGLESLSIPKEIPRLKLREAQKIIFERTGRDNQQEPDLEPEDEREISKWATEKHGTGFVFITHYPVAKRPFYTYEDPEDLGYTLSFDLIGYGMELMTGGQRIHQLDKLVENAQARNIDLQRSELYLQAFRYGMPPEGGFSFGSERIVMGILGLANVREASLFPRDMERIDVHLPTLYGKDKK
ncbi:aspartate--tRNA(Asn) ligase [Candidatus Roizmanbacteria bacterium RIFCSPHIGHO2_12_FULL_44_10]|uniref:Aspartate--tRNA(Asn) ligase n=1 Tax=Candidatus Roizmanbacteria bacterium RIFCSPHIGHO2_12_FULL_44_10 TaxID=1802054 RepID=A0A1F7I7C5_9BACT|nr:MAG: aspartate--tRNA(Asn) ligase [Candidatus Roizmanbacteria bacterium RIFCSPHIGHO2_12_FULL_44_10]